MNLDELLCPECNAEYLTERKAKWFCPGCGFLIPCCEGGDC